MQQFDPLVKKKESIFFYTGHKIILFAANLHKIVPLFIKIDALGDDDKIAWPKQRNDKPLAFLQ